MLHCKQCRKVKPDSCFYASNQSSCKECIKQNVRANRRANIGYYRAYDRERGNRQPAGYLKQYRASNGTKYQAHNSVNNALRDGKMTKPLSCEQCHSSSGLHGHHDDYSKPLEVRWLCPACHKAWHDENGEGINAA